MKKKCNCGLRELSRIRVLILITCHLSLVTLAYADNVVVANPPSQPVPIYDVAGGVKPVWSATVEASHVLKNSAGALLWLAVTDSAAEYILIIDSATVPSDGAVTLLYPPIKVAANTTTMVVLPAGLRATNGIVVCNSSTGTFTKTIGGSTCIFTGKVQ